MSEAVAISGTRRTMKELVDGTIRVQIDIDPRFRADFYRLLPDVDMGVALVPLALGAALDSVPEQAAPVAEKRASNSKFPTGYTGLAVAWCSIADFHDWLCATFPQQWHSASSELAKTPQERCAVVLKMVCGVASRKEFDTNSMARARFGDFIKVPYMAHRKEIGLE